MAQVEQLTHERDAAKGELGMAQDTARTYYQRMVQAESEKSHIQTSMVIQREDDPRPISTADTSQDCDRFVLVLIDGDGMPVRLSTPIPMYWHGKIGSVCGC